MTSPTFIHWAPIQIQDGIIEPGNWWRLLKLTNNLPLVVFELILETTRTQLKPDAPSRLKSNFVCFEISALNFQNIRKHQLDVKHMACFTHVPTAFFHGDFRLSALPEKHTIESLFQRAKEYWTTTPTFEFTEIFAESPIRVQMVSANTPSPASGNDVKKDGLNTGSEILGTGGSS